MTMPLPSDSAPADLCATALYRYRRARGLSQVQLAQLAEIHQSTLCRAERGEIVLHPANQARLATILGVCQHELFPAEPA